MDIFTALTYQPIYNLLIVFYRLFSDNLALALIAIALISRLITVPVQLLAYHTAVQMGTDVDQPRNLAKSVTVE